MGPGLKLLCYKGNVRRDGPYRGKPRPRVCPITFLFSGVFLSHPLEQKLRMSNTLARKKDLLVWSKTETHRIPMVVQVEGQVRQESDFDISREQLVIST